jgi:hypothetical protein
MTDSDSCFAPENCEVEIDARSNPHTPAMLARDGSEEYRGDLRQAMQRWREKEAQWWHCRNETGAEILNAVKRELYRREKAEKGEDVRPYVHRHIRQGQSEAACEYVRRRDREYKRKAYHAKAEANGRQVREYNDLSEMTVEELKAYKQEQNARNKRLNRERKNVAQAQISRADTSRLSE